jgi:hypothetical protein
MYKGRNHTPSPERSNASRMLYRFIRQVEAYFPWQSCFCSTVSLVCRPCSVGSIPQPSALPAPNWPSPAPTRHVATHRTPHLISLPSAATFSVRIRTLCTRHFLFCMSWLATSFVTRGFKHLWNSESVLFRRVVHEIFMELGKRILLFFSLTYVYVTKLFQD